MSEGFGGYLPPKVFSRHNYPQVTPLQHIFFFYYTCNEILILKVDTMKYLVIVDDMRGSKREFVCESSDLRDLIVQNPNCVYIIKALPETYVSTKNN